MNEGILIAMAIQALSDLVVALVNAKGDMDKKEQALYAAEEQMSRIRAKMKFG